MKTCFTCLYLLLFFTRPAFAQINFTANTLGKVPAYTGFFLYGSNMGYYDQTWDDNALADIAAGNPAYNIPGVGVKTLRPLLTERFLASQDPALGGDAYGWGYDVRVPQFEHYKALGMKDHTVFLAVNNTNPNRKDNIRPDHTDNTTYPGASEKSKMFGNLYQPIWDGGANGTPVNENNYFALFIYKTVQTYKPYTKFWEIGNEPDYTGSFNSFASPGQPGNWWDNPPTADDLTNLKAPVFNYIRCLRIAYEVIKSIDPTAYVCTGGIGYPSFLDALCRYTDNPDGGKVSTDYPNKGGAYFDVLSYHDYPQYEISQYTNGGRVYYRYSDAAANAVYKKKSDLQNVLVKYGYNDSQYPAKLWIITESNIPRKQYPGSTDIGSTEAQRNFLQKTLVLSQKWDIRQFYVFNLSESSDEASSGYPGDDLMGLYYNIKTKGPLVADPTTGGQKNSGNYRQQVNPSGIAYKTTSDILSGYRFDAAKTTALNLPAEVEGAAFQSTAGKYVYALWAKTKTDNSESASAVYSFPAAAGASATLEKKEWDYSQTKTTANVASTNIPLTGSVVFLSDANANPNPTPTPTPGGGANPNAVEDPAAGFGFRYGPNPFSQELTLGFDLQKPETVTLAFYDEQGKAVQTLVSEQKLTAGTHLFSLKNTGLPSGLYICRLQIGQNTLVRKVVLIK